MIRLTNIVFLTAVLLSCIVLFICPQDAPPYLDFDVATEASFVWSYLYGIPFDYPDPSLFPRYSIETFRAERIAFAICLAPIVWLLDIPAFYLGEFFKLAAGLMTVVLGLVSGLIVSRESKDGTALRLFIIAFSCTYPPLMLLSRNGLLFNILTAVLFWAVVYLIDRYSRTNNSKYLYICSAVAAFFLFNRYPQMATLPLVALGVLLSRKKVFPALRDKHVYGSLLLFATLSIAALTTIGFTAFSGPGEYISHLQKFQNMRSRTFSIGFNLLGSSSTDKLNKAINQQLLFKYDKLGDPKREDETFTLGESNFGMYALAIMFFLGLISSIKQRPPDAAPFAWVLGILYLTTLTISFPEGRYLICVIPCYAYFAWRGIQLCLPNRRSSQLLLGAFLLLVNNGFSSKVLFTTYNESAHKTLEYHEGLQELAMHLPDPEVGEKQVLSNPIPQRRKLWHYYIMLVGLETPWITMDKFDVELEKFSSEQGSSYQKFFFQGFSEKDKWSKKYLGKGFVVVKRFETKLKGESRILLQYPPP